MKKLLQEIKKIKNKLSNKPSCENFGQNEVEKLQNKYIDSSSYTSEMNSMREAIDEFDNWCMSR